MNINELIERGFLVNDFETKAAHIAILGEVKANLRSCRVPDENTTLHYHASVGGYAEPIAEVLLYKDGGVLIVTTQGKFGEGEYLIHPDKADSVVVDVYKKVVV